jgi:hypothetical protein
VGSIYTGPYLSIWYQQMLAHYLPVDSA